MTTDDETTPRGVDLSDIKPDDAQWRLMNKYKMKRFPGKQITLPTGIPVEAARFANVRPPGADNGFVLHSPEKIMLNPKPGYRYIWRIRADEETIGLVETACIRPVKMSEINRADRRTAKLFPWTGPGGESYAGWKRHALFEVPPDIAYEWFGQPEDYALAKLANLGPQFEANVAEQTGGKMAGEFTRKDTRSAAQERQAGPQRRG